MFLSKSVGSLCSESLKTDYDLLEISLLKLLFLLWLFLFASIFHEAIFVHIKFKLIYKLYALV